ncbi:MAG: hypothetical protein Q8922_00555 [Bacteroidota bacterium]|nr:hypothetical protein [Bacteroidota bacterium]MDP4232524.1 hypothetical protein [Bacteroidota bacterium]MDP4241659.1 hypothetical protein [Bacteroidota bacterium]MDP4286404.1 hypothetical protein [Bacteroidota bacterium]
MKRPVLRVTLLSFLIWSIAMGLILLSWTTEDYRWLSTVALGMLLLGMAIPIIASMMAKKK